VYALARFQPAAADATFKPNAGLPHLNHEQHGQSSPGLGV